MNALGQAGFFMAALMLGALGAACVLKLGLDVFIVSKGGALYMSFGKDTSWSWPRDGLKIVASMTAAAALGAVCLGLAYYSAIQGFGAGL